MITRLHPRFRFVLQSLLLGLAATIILTACGGTPGAAGVATQPIPQDQASAEAPQPVATQQPGETQASAGEQEVVPTPAGSNVSGIHPCDLVTKEEAEAAYGGPVGEPAEEIVPPIYSCRYPAANLNYVGVTLTVFDDAKQAGDAFQSMIDINQYEEISGIGDRALKPAIFDIDVLKGKYDLSVNIVNDSDEETRFAKAKELAALALGRLP